MKYLIYILLAAVLWYVMFVIRPFNFWLMMAFSTSLLSAVSLYYYKDQLFSSNWSFKEVGIGITSALLLYGIFWFGKFLLDNLGFIPNHEQSINSVYANIGSVPRWVVAMLLFFPIGFGEEIFWRGYLQRHLGEKYSKWSALFITVFFYTVVHLPTMNFVLILAAFLVGIYWGLIFMWRGSIVAALISHMIWDPLIFAIAPVS